MRKFLILFGMGVLLFACEKRVTPDFPSPGLHKEALSDLSGIPASFGKLVSVTAHAQYAGWSQLWFVDDSSTIRMVRVEFHINRIHEQVLVIPRN